MANSPEANGINVDQPLGADRATSTSQHVPKSEFTSSGIELTRQLLVENLSLAGLALLFAFAVLHVTIAELSVTNPLLLNPALNGRMTPWS